MHTGICKSIGATVISTTRNSNKLEFLKQYGADFVLLENISLSEQLFILFPNGVNKVLELVGTVTLKKSLKLLSQHGILCMTGILGGEWVLDNFEPMMDIPSGAYFTQFDSGENFKEKLLVEMFKHIEQHRINVPIAQVFPLDEIQKPHVLMENNKANGKIVVTIPN